MPQQIWMSPGFQMLPHTQSHWAEGTQRLPLLTNLSPPLFAELFFNIFDCFARQLFNLQSENI